MPVTNATAPKSVTVDGVPVARSAWAWDAAAGKVTVTVPQRSVRQQVTVNYR
ncbi:hypothetical protein [Streptomyces sp. NPDC088910]|uniref:hypothetical protein n=1 Tax=Streptomyces sp. NPDC088910 TaxID=3365911 RepID=UPI00381B6A2F